MKNWEKQFDKEFPAIKVKTYTKDSVVYCSACNEEMGSWHQLEDIKQFIKSLLEEQEEKHERLAKLAMKFQLGLQKKELLEGLKERDYTEEVEMFKINNNTIEGEFHEQFLNGYNQAIQEIKSKLNKL
jgi:hypothetical protein